MQCRKDKKFLQVVSPRHSRYRAYRDDDGDDDGAASEQQASPGRRARRTTSSERQRVSVDSL